MNKYSFKKIVTEFINFTKANIVDLAQKELENTEKKAKLDKAIKTYLETLLIGVKVNFVTKWVVEKYVIQNIPTLTQAIYDLLKARITNVTKG